MSEWVTARLLHVSDEASQHALCGSSGGRELLGHMTSDTQGEVDLAHRFTPFDTGENYS